MKSSFVNAVIHPIVAALSVFPWQRGSLFNPYEGDEFPENHVHGLSSKEMEAFRNAWHQNPELQNYETTMQPDWDKLFAIAGID